MIFGSPQNETKSPLPFSEREIIERKLAVYRYPHLVTPEMWEAYQTELKRQETAEAKESPKSMRSTH